MQCEKLKGHGRGSSEWLLSLMKNICLDTMVLPHSPVERGKFRLTHRWSHLFDYLCSSLHHKLHLNLNGLKQQIFVTLWFLFLRNLNIILAEHVWLKLSARAAVSLEGVSFWDPCSPDHGPQCCCGFLCRADPWGGKLASPGVTMRERDQDGSYNHYKNQTWNDILPFLLYSICQKKISMSSQHSRVRTTPGHEDQDAVVLRAPFRLSAKLCWVISGYLEGIWQKHKKKGD